METHAQASDSLLCDDHVYEPGIKTILFAPAGAPGRPPVLHLDSPGQLVLSFDELNGEERSLHYTMIHCDASWHPSALLPQDYREGLPESAITDSRSSFNTRKPYMHYSVTIPGEQKLLLSGNYIVLVYEADTAHPLLSARMMVSEDAVTVNGRVHQATDVESKKYKQEVDFTISHDKLSILNPFTDLQVCIYQNGRKDNAITGLKPRYVRDNLLDYDYESENVFDGGNEFREFDARTLRSNGVRIIRTTFEIDGPHLYVEQDEKRSYLRYAENPDMDGGFRVRTTDGQNDSLESDYVWVNLELACSEPYADGELFVLGDFNRWAYDSSSSMQYDAGAHAYRCRLLLKQGIYDYEYILRPEGLAKGETSVVEGDHYETENEYRVCVYLRDPTGRYDRLVAVSSLWSGASK